MTKPNFFIVGAPKCGTTSLYEYLKVHPEICMCTPKEPHFFADDFSEYIRTYKDMKTYLEKGFEDITRQHKAVGEASVSYLSSECALQNIKSFNPEARIIVMLRHPVDIVISLHAQTCKELQEDKKDIMVAWKLQEKRKRGKYIPTTCKEPKYLQYATIASLGKQVQNLYAIFPEEQVLLIFFEDFIKNTNLHYKRVLDFLKVEDDHRDAFPITNKRKKIRSAFVASLYTGSLPLLFLKFLSIVKNTLGIQSMNIRNHLRMWNEIDDLSHDDLEYKTALLGFFADDIKILSEVTKRDLSHWFK